MFECKRLGHSLRAIELWFGRGRVVGPRAARRWSMRSIGCTLPATAFRGACMSLGILAFLFTCRPSAAGADEFYIVQDTSTKQCAIADSPPTTTTLRLLDNGKFYSDRNEAERAMASLACTAARPATASIAKGRDGVRPKGRAHHVDVERTASIPTGQRQGSQGDPPSLLNWLQRLSPF
jgi:hypothetical protein